MKTFDSDILLRGLTCPVLIMVGVGASFAMCVVSMHLVHIGFFWIHLRIHIERTDEEIAEMISRLDLPDSNGIL